MTARLGTCAYCGAEGRIEDDHPTLRDEQGRPCDPDFVVDACASCNKGRWHAFRVASAGRFDVHPTARGQAALTFFFGTSADRGCALTLTVPQQRAVARVLLDGATVIVALLGVVAVLGFLLWGTR